MRIDPKYFNVFILIMALIGAAIIAFFSFSNDRGGRLYFKDFITSSDSLSREYWPRAFSDDSLRIADMEEQYVLVDFWSTRSIYGDKRHLFLNELRQRYPERLRVLAAAVRDRMEDIRAYEEEHAFNFTYVNGNRNFSKYRVPGIPTMLLYEPGGHIHTVFVGFQEKGEIDSLARVIADGQ